MYVYVDMYMLQCIMFQKCACLCVLHTRHNGGGKKSSHGCNKGGETPGTTHMHMIIQMCRLIYLYVSTLPVALDATKNGINRNMCTGGKQKVSAKATTKVIVCTFVFVYLSSTISENPDIPKEKVNWCMFWFVYMCINRTHGKKKSWKNYVCNTGNDIRSYVCVNTFVYAYM